MTDPNTPAFPSTHMAAHHTGVGCVEKHVPGMSLRDWFAGMALANPYTHNESDCDRVAEWAFHIADAMLAARAKGGADD